MSKLALSEILKYGGAKGGSYARKPLRRREDDNLNMFGFLTELYTKAQNWHHRTTYANLYG